VRRLLPRTEQQDVLYRNIDNDPEDWGAPKLAARNYYKPGYLLDRVPRGRVIRVRPKGSYWRGRKEKIGGNWGC